MTTEKQIKIIKRAGRGEALGALPEKPETVVETSGLGAKQDAVKVVTGWVRELRRKKSEEAAQGFERLFGKAA